MLVALKHSVGRSRANPHILETLVALHLGDTERAKQALARSRVLLREKMDEVDKTNLANILSLQRQLDAAVGEKKK